MNATQTMEDVNMSVIIIMAHLVVAALTGIVFWKTAILVMVSFAVY